MVRWSYLREKETREVEYFESHNQVFAYKEEEGPGGGIVYSLTGDKGALSLVRYPYATRTPYQLVIHKPAEKGYRREYAFSHCPYLFGEACDGGRDEAFNINYMLANYPTMQEYLLDAYLDYFEG